VLIRVNTAGIAIWDAAERKGGFKSMGQKEEFPYLLGSDCAGEVAAVGSEVSEFSEGDMVYAYAFLNPPGGTYAEYAAVTADQVSRIPEGFPVEQAGVIAVDGLTALTGIHDKIEARENSNIAIFGANGGVGHIAVQIASRLGARVLAIASGSDGVELVQGLGADEAVDGKSSDIEKTITGFAPDGLDGVLLTAGGAAADACLRGLKDGGKAAWPNGIHPLPTLTESVSPGGYNGAVGREELNTFNRLIEQGAVQCHIHESFSLDEVKSAHENLGRHVLGKRALRI
jgi:NADPH:quinone reductase-like Zn-dependent oxidoreductase